MNQVFRQFIHNMFIKLKRKEPVTSLLDNLSDELLVSQYLESGNKELIAVLFERYTHLVYGICLNYLQEPEQCKDAVMDIFESLFDKLATHRVSNFRSAHWPVQSVIGLDMGYDSFSLEIRIHFSG